MQSRLPQTRRVIEHRVNSLLHRGEGERFALAFLDIDGFKHINDYYGHGIGDALLAEMAGRLGRGLRETPSTYTRGERYRR
jgi:c-di-GMP phosphodiesterase Gmr